MKLDDLPTRQLSDEIEHRLAALRRRGLVIHVVPDRAVLPPTADPGSGRTPTREAAARSSH